MVLSALLLMVSNKVAPFIENKATTFIEGKLELVLSTDIKEEAVKLQTTLSAIKAVLDDAEEKQATDKALELWLSKLKDAAYDADNLLDEFKLNALEKTQDGGDHNWIMEKILLLVTCCSDQVIFRYRMAHGIRGITEMFDSLDKARSVFNLMVAKPTTDARPPTHSYFLESEVVGRAEDVNKIVERLIGEGKNTSVTVLPIVGMGGLGKTTLAQIVFNDIRVRDHFELLVWSFAAHNFSVEKIAKEMIETSAESGFALSDLDYMVRNLRKVVGVKRYLLVVDDVWSKDRNLWDQMKIVLSFGAQGSAVLATTRSDKVSDIMRTLDAYHLGQLPEEECWTLFRRRAFAGREETPDLIAIGRDIVRKGGMLPLAAKALGGLMNQKTDEREWKAVLNSEIWDQLCGEDQPEGESEVLPALRLSYCHLNPRTKQCFAFCALFPKGHVIEKETLIKLWMGNGFILSARNPMDTEINGSDIFRELQQMSFFQDVDEGRRSYGGKRLTTCRMHDLIHDLARSIMGNQCCILDKWEEGNTALFSGAHYLSLNCNKREGSSSQSASLPLRTLLLRGSQPDDLNSWRGAKYLRALGLRNTGLTEFPISIRDFRYLRYLDLSGNDIQTLPEDIRRLLFLQTLNLSGCSKLLGLPSSMRHMSNLMYLYLEGCGGLRSMPAGMGQLRRLRTLTRYVAGVEAGSGGIGELHDLDLQGALELYNLKNVTNVMEAQEASLISKENLEQLDLDWGEYGYEPRAAAIIEEEVRGALQPYPKLRGFEVSYKGVLEQPDPERDPSSEPLLDAEVMIALRPYPKLKQLLVRPEWAVAGLDLAVAAGIPVETVIQIIRPHLRSSPPMLEVHFLIRAPRTPEGVRLHCKNVMNLYNPRNPEQLVTNQGESGDEPRTTTATSEEEEEVLRALQPNLRLKQLAVRRYRGTTYPKWLTTGLLSNLVEIVLTGCSRCEHLPQLWKLPRLEALEIGGAESVTHMGGTEFYGPAGVGEAFPLLRRLKLYEMLSLEDWSEVLEGRHSFSRIEEVEIIDCPALRTMPALPSARYLQITNCPLLQPARGFLKRMKSLERLELETCDELVLMLEREDGPGGPIRSLHIKYCQQSIFSSPSLGMWRHFHSLQNLEIKLCDGLVMFPVEVFQGLKSLKRLVIHVCKFLRGSSSSSGEDEGLRFQNLPALEELNIQVCPAFPRFHPEGLKHLSALKSLLIYSNHGLTELPDFPESVREVTIYNCWNLVSLPVGLGRLPSLVRFVILSCNRVVSFPEEAQGYKALRTLKIDDCFHLASMSAGLQQRLPSLNSLEIRKTPKLERRCMEGGEYWDLVSQIPVKYIGGS